MTILVDIANDRCSGIQDVGDFTLRIERDDSRVGRAAYGAVKKVVFDIVSDAVDIGINIERGNLVRGSSFNVNRIQSLSLNEIPIG